MSAELRKTGLSAVGDAPWGTHFCFFYDTSQDLLDTLVPYFKAGLDNNEFCMLVVSEPLTVDEARSALRQAVPDLDPHLAKPNIEILPHDQFYLKEGAPDLQGVIRAWMVKLDQALARGYAGMRVAGIASWVRDRDLREFHEYEREIDGLMASRSAILLCAYPLASSGAADAFDIAQSHQFALATRQGTLAMVETPALRQGKAEIERLNAELERRVVERTRELAAVNEKLRKEIEERERVEDELRLSHQTFHGSFDHAPIGMTVASPGGRWLKANGAFCKILGYSEEELLRMKVQAVTHSDDLEANLGGIQQLLDGKIDSFTMEKRYYHKDGHLVWANLSSTVVRNAKGDPLYIVSQIHDISERKRSEEQIKFQASLIDQVRSAVIAIDLELNVVSWNSFAETLYQWTTEEAVGRQIIELMVPDEALTTAGEMFKSIGTAGHWEGEFVLRRKDGSSFPAYVHVAATRGTNGEVIGFVGVSSDITERKQLDRELKESEDRFRSFMDNLPGLAWIKDANGRYVYMNKPLQNVLPKHREDWMGRTDDDFWPPEVASEYRTNDQQVLRYSQKLQALETLDREGQIRYVLVSKFRMFGAQGGLLVAGVAIDITERKQAERALHESQVHLQAILDNCPAMIFLKDVEGRYLQVNRQLEQTLNLTSEQILGRTDADIFAPELAADFRSSDQRVLEEGRSLAFEELAFYAGGPRTNIVHKFPLKDASGNIYAIGGIATDITARKLEEEELGRQKEVLQKIFDHIPVLISFIGGDGRFKLVNREWERTLGWSLEDVMNQDIDVLREQYPDPRDHQAVLDFIAGAHGKWAKFKTRVRDGRLIDTTWATVRLSDGTSIGIGQDITEQERAQEALSESHNFQQAIVEGSPDAVFVKDLQGRYQMINSAGAGFIGKPVEEIIGKDDAHLFAPEVGRRIMQHDQEVMASAKAQTFEENIPAAGLKLTFLTTKDVYRDSKGAVVGLIGIARDISARKRAEERLQEYEKAVEGLEDMIAVVDHEYRYLLANRAFLKYRGMEREQLLGRTVSEVLGREVFEKVVKPKIDECLRGSSVNYELTYTYPQLGERDLFVSYFPVEGPDGVNRVACVLRDITDRKRAEEALRESEERFSKAFHSSPAALSMSLLEDGRLVEVNSAFLQLTGYSQDEVLDKTSLELGLWASPDHRMTMAQTLHERGAVRDLETRFRKKSGEVRNVLLSVELIELRAKRCVLGIVQDITDRKRTEEALRESEERYRDLVENAHDIIYSHDLDGNYTSVNKAVEQITGYTREEALRMNLAQIVAPDYQEQARAMIRKKLEGEKETVYDIEIVAKDGNRIAIEVNSILIRQNGLPIGIHGIARDVTERKRVQEELREREESYRDLVENSTELICTHDLDGLILSANRASINVLGYDENEYVGKANLREILPVEVRDQFEDYLARVRRDGVASGVMVAQTRTGERRIWEYHNTLRTEGVAKPIVRGMARDITESRRAEAQIKATSEQLRALSASLRSAREEEGTRIARELHDELGSALTGLKLDLEEVQRSLSGHGSEANTSALQQKLASMTGLADQTIDALKRISAELRPSILDDLGLVAAIEWQCEQFEARSGIPCKCHSLIEKVDVTRDRATAVFRVLQEAFTNILRHAQATRVTVTIQEEDGEIVFEVRDDGRGITDNERANPRSLGLTGMRERVNLTGGTIEVTGAAGIGTVLTVRVPGSAKT